MSLESILTANIVDEVHKLMKLDKINSEFIQFLINETKSLKERVEELENRFSKEDKKDVSVATKFSQSFAKECANKIDEDLLKIAQEHNDIEKRYTKPEPIKYVVTGISGNKTGFSFQEAINLFHNNSEKRLRRKCWDKEEYVFYIYGSFLKRFNSDNFINCFIWNACFDDFKANDWEIVE